MSRLARHLLTLCSAVSLVLCVATFVLLAAAAERAPAAPRTRSPRDARTLRVMTYNIHITQGMDGRFDPRRIAGVIEAADVDIVAMQEVDIKTRRSGGVDQLAELKKLTGMHGVFGKGRDFDGGE